MASLLASAVLTPGSEGLDTPHGFLTRLLLIPGLTSHIQVQYPVIPWFGIARDGAGYLAVYVVWIASWWPLYVVTRRYRDFKQTKAADSYWRMF